MRQVSDPPIHGLSAGLRQYLYLTAAVTGGVILVVEILGAKMLTPYIGTSHFVWTAQIAVTLVSLAAGYYVGGWLVDRTTDLKLIYFCILGAATYLTFTIGTCETVAHICLEFRLAFGSILAAMFLFFVPLTLLAAVGPFLVRVLMRSVEDAGRQVGRLSAISTLGSVAGTVLIGYVLIPLFPNSMIMCGAAGILVVVVSGYFAVWSRTTQTLVVTAMGVAICTVNGIVGVRQDLLPRFPGYRELARVNSAFGLMQVLERDGNGFRYFFLDKLIQNGIDTQTGQSIDQFTYMTYGLTRVYNEHIESVLCIGLGVGISPMAFAQDGAKVDVVEINPSMVHVASNYFGLNQDDLHIVIDDGRHYLNECNSKYSAVVLDVFLGDSSPSHLMTQEAFYAIKNVLEPGGTLVINSFGNVSDQDDVFVASINKTLKSVFRSVVIHSDGGGNTYFVAADRCTLAFVREPDFATIHPSMRYAVRQAYSAVGKTDSGRGISLSDDFNPIEYYDAANREVTRKALAIHLRSQ